MKLKAAILRKAGMPRPYAASRPLHIETVEVPPPAAGEVIVAIKAASLLTWKDGPCKAAASSFIISPI